MKARVLAVSVAALAVAHKAEPADAKCRTTACWHRVHWMRHHPFEHRQHHLPEWGKAMLARLRGCETRGIAFPANYEYNGHHQGAYQYTLGTWQRTVPYLPTRKLRHWASGGPAYSASPAEQDVRTFYFYPSHRGEWACSA